MACDDGDETFVGVDVHASHLTLGSLEDIPEGLHPTRSFEFTIGPRTTGDESVYCYYVNGIECPRLRLMIGEVYQFVIDTPGYPWYLSTVARGGPEDFENCSVDGLPKGKVILFRYNGPEYSPDGRRMCLYYCSSVQRYMGNRIEFGEPDEDTVGPRNSVCRCLPEDGYNIDMLYISKGHKHGIERWSYKINGE